MKAPNMAAVTPSLERSLIQENRSLKHSPSAVVQLNSHLSLPHYWQQCLDLKTGEIYFINWSNGTRSTEDPRLMKKEYDGGFPSSEEDESGYDGEESSSESSPSLLREQEEKEDVLVVVGCKICLMYYMVAKSLEYCPKCDGRVIQFHGSI